MKKIKLLLLDDDFQLRKNLQLFFEDEGFETYPFENPLDALSFLKSKHVNAGIIDLRLPVINGEEFIIEANKINSEIKFIIYTGSADYFVSPELKNLGITQDDVFSKPISSMDIFTNKIKSLLKNTEELN